MSSNRILAAVAILLILFASTTASVSARSYDNKILLTDPSNNKTAYFEDLKNEIKNAKTSIHLDMFLLEYKQNATKDFPPNIILDELVKAKNRGVDVRMTINPATSTRHPDTEPYLIKNGMAYKLTGTHAKLAVIDDRIAYMGSSNWNWRGLKYNYETNIKTENPDIIKEANVFLDHRWKRTSSGTVANNSSETLLTGKEYFNEVRTRLAAATSRVQIVIYDVQYSTTTKNFPTILLDEVLNATKRGVKVQILLDDSTLDTRPNVIKFLKNNNIPFRVDDDAPVIAQSRMLEFMSKNNIHEDLILITHSKLLIIDGVVYVGSHNWTKDGLDTSGDATMKTKDSNVLSDYLRAFGDAWNRGRIV